MEPNMLLVRKVAADNELDERTVVKALQGERSRVLSTRKRQIAAVEDYNRRLATEENTK